MKIQNKETKVVKDVDPKFVPDYVGTGKWVVVDKK